jgi:hypothetical protein
MDCRGAAEAFAVMTGKVLQKIDRYYPPANLLHGDGEWAGKAPDFTTLMSTRQPAKFLSVISAPQTPSLSPNYPHWQALFYVGKMTQPVDNYPDRR